MVPSNKEFTPLVPPSTTRPRSNWHGDGSRAKVKIFLRDQLTIEGWLCLGAALQAALYLVGGSITFIPGVGLLLWRGLMAMAMSKGWIHNSYRDNIIHQKFAAVFPHDLGHYGSKPSDSDVVVLLIGSRSNSPLGMLAPGFKQLGNYFRSMSEALDNHNEEFGFLGMTSWLNASDRETASELMSVCYFRTTEGLQKFAHSWHHRTAWEWYNKTAKEIEHISIWHETYHAPKGHWESIYANSHLSGINATAHRFTDMKTGDLMWARPVVDASKGLLKTSGGRMGRSSGDEHHAYEKGAYY